MNDIFDEMWPLGPRLLKKGAFPVGTDAVLLSDFAGTLPGKKICDLGCGSALIAILLLWENAGKSAVGVEINEEAAKTAERNASENGLSDRLDIICGDIRAHRTVLPGGAFDLTVSNPPYYPAGSGALPLASARALARGESECTLADVCAAASYVTKWGGSFCMVHKPERLSEALCALTASGLEPKRLRFIESRAGKAPSLFLVDARRGGRPGLKIEPPLVLFGADGLETDEVKRIYHRL